MIIKVVKNPIKKSELLEVASQGFGDIVKAVVDVIENSKLKDKKSK